MSAQYAVKPCFQPQNAFRAGHRKEAKGKEKTKVKDSNNNTTTQKHKL